MKAFGQINASSFPAASHESAIPRRAVEIVFKSVSYGANAASISPDALNESAIALKVEATNPVALVRLVG